MRTLLLAVALMAGPGVAQEGKVSGPYGHLKMYMDEPEKELKVEWLPNRQGIDCEWGRIEYSGLGVVSHIVCKKDKGLREDGVIVWRKAEESK